MADTSLCRWMLDWLCDTGSGRQEAIERLDRVINMPYYLETDDRELLKKLLHTNICKECGDQLEALYDIKKHLPYLQCKATPGHEGIAKEYRGPRELNIPTRRERMVNDHGKETTTALDKARLPMTGALTQPQAEHILSLVYPEVPRDEVIRCAILCRDFGLHPLMKEVYIIPFNVKGGGKNWVTVIGINATRKMMARQGTYSYIDNTPRVMTEKEQKEIFGEADELNIVAITKLRTREGEEAPGYGRWPKDKMPYGTDKGNTRANMAFIRSERNALGRLFGDALPQGVEVVDEAYVDIPDIGKVAKGTGEIIEAEFEEIPAEKPVTTEVPETPKEHWCYEHNCAFKEKSKGTSVWWAHELGKGKYCNEKKAKAASAVSQAETPPEPKPEGEKPERDVDAIKSLNDLFKACNEDWKLQPADILKELNVETQSDISDTPAECYRKIAAVR